MIENLTSKELKVDLDLLNKLKDAVKDNFKKIGEVSAILEKYPFLKNDINNRIKNGVLFQPGRIVETMVIQSIADYLGCVYIGNGIYDSDNFTIEQDGGSGMPDLIIHDNFKKEKYIFEIKEPVAYGKSCGFTYDDSGRPVEFTSKDKKMQIYVESLFENGGKLSSYNILDNQGHNKIFEINDIITNEFDYIISYDSFGFLSIMKIDEYKNGYTFKIEVRPCGRNTRKVFTKNKLNLVDDIVYLDKNDIKDIIQRGGKKSSRYKYICNSATFSFKKNHLKEKDGILYIEFNKIKQHVGEVSIQHFKK